MLSLVADVCYLLLQTGSVARYGQYAISRCGREVLHAMVKRREVLHAMVKRREVLHAMVKRREVLHAIVYNYAISCCRREVLQIQYADGISRIGGVKWTIALALFGVFFVVYFALWKGIKSSGKVGYNLGRVSACLSIPSFQSRIS